MGNKKASPNTGEFATILRDRELIDKLFNWWKF